MYGFKFLMLMLSVTETQNKKRSQPGDFERQVEQIRKDIRSVRKNLALAQKYVSIFNLNCRGKANKGFFKTSNV